MSIPTTGFDPESARWLIAMPSVGRTVEVNLAFLPLGTEADDVYDIVASGINDIKTALETAFPLTTVSLSHTLAANLTIS